MWHMQKTALYPLQFLIVLTVNVRFNVETIRLLGLGAVQPEEAYAGPLCTPPTPGLVSDDSVIIWLLGFLHLFKDKIAIKKSPGPNNCLCTQQEPSGPNLPYITY